MLSKTLLGHRWKSSFKYNTFCAICHFYTWFPAILAGSISLKKPTKVSFLMKSTIENWIQIFNKGLMDKIVDKILCNCYWA
jgi:hypothetical protein